MTRLVPLILLAVLGCGTTDTEEPWTGTDTGLGDRINNLRWEVDFDATAEANGFFDCTYGRRYTRGVEDRSAPWLCPDCDVVYRVDVTMHEGWEECYAQLSSQPSPVEFHHISDGRFWRGSLNWLLSEQGEATPTERGFDILNITEPIDLDGGGTRSFVVSGELERGQGATDPMNGYAPPDTYACGWPKADPQPWEGPWTMAVGGPMPDGFFLDHCGESVRLHDFLGQYLVLDVSAVDCGPCQVMAAEAESALESLREEVDVEAITLLAPTLSAVFDPTPQATLQEWIDTFGLTSPVLADRGYGYWTIGLGLVAEDFGYPTWVVVAPDLEVIQAGVGFASGSWADIEAIIRENAAR